MCDICEPNGKTKLVRIKEKLEQFAMVAVSESASKQWYTLLIDSFCKVNFWEGQSGHSLTLPLSEPLLQWTKNEYTKVPLKLHWSPQWSLKPSQRGNKRSFAIQYRL